MRILFLTHAFNSLAQRLYVELCEGGHSVSVEFDVNDTVTIDAVNRFQPDLIVAPYLKRAIPRAIWTRHLCLVVHPGIPGDRGPSALDWAILNRERQWGVTVLQANAVMDGGAIWAHSEFPLRAASKASLYRREVTEAAVQAVLLAVTRYEQGDFSPRPPGDAESCERGIARPLMRQHDRRIDWRRDDTAAVLRKIASADGFPGVRDRLCGRELFLYDAHAEPKLTGTPGTLIARCGGAVCRATVDGAVWIGHLRDRQAAHPFKLPATTVLADQVAGLPEIAPGAHTGYRDIWYEERHGVGYLHFPFYNGAMGTDQCRRLLAAYRAAQQQDTRVIVLLGGPEFWSNGMHLNLIEAANSAADESWRNINAIDDLAEAIIGTTSHLTIAALQGNAGAGGVFLARCADYVWARAGTVLNPHYRDMGNLYGSEFWTYLLPRHVGRSRADRIVHARLPMGAREAHRLGLVDEVIEACGEAFMDRVMAGAATIARAGHCAALLSNKRRKRLDDEAEKPLKRYREEELEQMRLNFYGFDPSYHVARYNFVYKVPKSRTPVTIARHRRASAATVRQVS